MKFTKTETGAYVATRKDGQVIRIEKTYWDDGVPANCTWRVDFDGDNTGFARTKRELVEIENHYERNL